ncbi:MAG TPA: DinB family protein, partial [Thermoanaerobaculia bacterium]|nr:DinB family protein [Thermoanaerobaculia bacterium]
KPSDEATLANLLDLYAHDLSDTFGLELGPDGRFGYEKLPLYWSESEGRFAFLIRQGTHLAGFALITQGSPGSDDPQAFDVAEFFVVRRHRRSGIGRQAAFLLWDRFPVRWIVRVAEGNQRGLRFWESVIREYSGGSFVKATRPSGPQAWQVFSLDSRRSPMKDRRFDLADSIAILERTPALLKAWLDGLPERWVRATEGEGTWSPYDVIGHLNHAERTDWIPRARHILAGDPRPFETFDRTAMFTESQGKSLSELLATFAELRQTNLSTLAGMNLNDEDLDRKGLHPALGEVTLGQLLATWVVHDLDHIAQIARTMAKVYSEATGPWVEYLSILKDRRR